MSGLAESMAARAASKQAESLLAPLLSDDESDTEDDDSSTDSEDSPEVVKQTPLQKLKTTAIYVLLGAGTAASAAAFIITPGIFVYVAGGVCIANVPYSAYKERQMSKIPTLRNMNNRLRNEANRLEENVDNLSAEIDELVPEADRTKVIEGELRDIADRQQFNVNKLVDLVQENETILAQMRDNLRQRIVQDVIKIVMGSDKDNDQSIDNLEAKTLALKIRLQLQEYGVELDSMKFLQVIKENPTVTGVIAVVQKLLPSDEEDDDDDEDSDEDEDIYDMFYMADNIEKARGSVSSARSSQTGSRVSLSPKLQAKKSLSFRRKK